MSLTEINRSNTSHMAHGVSLRCLTLSDHRGESYMTKRVSSSTVRREQALIFHAGDNDGLVSLESARWGKYIGTLENVNHL